MDVAKIDHDVAHVANVCSTYFICFFRRMLQVCLFRCCIYFTHMLQEYVRNILDVSFLCWNKCFHVASCRYFIWMLYMFYTHVASECPNCFICSDVCCFQVFHVASVCVLEVCSKSHGGTARAPGKGARRAGGRQMGRMAHLRSCRRGVLVLIPPPGSHPREERG
jgi:hypothetical protein